MNKKKVDGYLDRAREALINSGIVQNNKINKTYRGQISSFGAAITMGSLKSAVAFFSDKGGSDTDRPKLMKSICYVLNIDESKTAADYEDTALYYYIEKNVNNTTELKESVINAAIALKLAMNLFELKKD